MILRRIVRRIRAQFAIDEFTDLNIRRRFSEKHQIDVGLYSYGCFDPSRIDPHTSIGRYCSFATSANVLNRNHGLGYIGTTPYLYNSRLGVVPNDTIEFIPCKIEDDVWVGHNAVLAPSVRHVGRGAVIAAGAIVTKDVPPYAVVAGVPGVPIRFRFPEALIEQIEATRWWEWDTAELKARAHEMPDLTYRPAEYFRNGTEIPTTLGSPHADPVDARTRLRARS